MLKSEIIEKLQTKHNNLSNYDIELILNNSISDPLGITVIFDLLIPALIIPSLIPYDKAIILSDKR